MKNLLSIFLKKVELKNFYHDLFQALQSTKHQIHSSNLAHMDKNIIPSTLNLELNNNLQLIMQMLY